jgi:predicted ATPase/signal transduction histidine kinase/tRNA A-37 threonylcarbamoyl transferase component Bud32
VAVPLHGFATSRLLRSSSRARVYEARRERDDKLVVAKVFDVSDPAIEARAEHEFELVHRLEVDGVVRALALERSGDHLVLLLERVPGMNLEEYAGGKPMAVDEFLRIAIALARTLAQVHACGVLHRDIKPSNILIEAGTRRPYLADFGLSMLLATDSRHFNDPDVLTGTLPFISPEQTGRLKRPVDFRSDLYSLGATFYELLTGRRPFTASTPLELIQAHLARRARAPYELRPELPELLSVVVMRLLEKLPERRYQSAAGLQTDLERLAAALEAGERQPSFVLGEHDHPTTLQMPHRLYGRSAELDELDAMLATTITEHRPGVALIVGEPGVGKSALIDAFEELMARRSGRLASGSFSAGPRESPARGVVEAITALCDQLLIESDERLADWREQLSRSLGPLARVIVELVPSAEVLFGEQPESPPLEPAEARNRLHLAIARFLDPIADRMPLVLALDDVDQADPSSLELLRSLMFGGVEGSVLFVLGLGRAALDDADEAHAPLRSLVAALEARPGTKRITPGPLSRADLGAWLAELLARPLEQVDELVELVARRTESNPLLVQQFVRHLADTKLLRAEASGWSWDARTIATAEIPGDLVAMLSAKLDRLPADQRRVLALAACIGFEFEIRTLEAIAGLPALELAVILHSLEQAGLLATNGRCMQFTHERLVEPAAALLDADERAARRWAIGRHLLDRSPASDSMRAATRSIEETGDVSNLRLSDDELFTMVEHLAAGFEHATDLDDELRSHIARQALEAGRRALRSTSWSVARRLLDFAVALIELRIADARRGYDVHGLAFAIHFAHAQAQALDGSHVQADASFDALLDWQLPEVARGQVIARRVRILTLQERRPEAIRVGLAGLARMGIELRLPVGRFTALRWTMRAWLAWRRSDPATLPAATDPRAIAALDIANALKVPAFTVDVGLFVTLNSLAADLTLRHGRHPTTAIALAHYGLAVYAGFGKPEVAARICDQAMALLEVHPNTSARARAESAALVVWATTRPFRELLGPSLDSMRHASEAGDVEVAGFQGVVSLAFHWSAGIHLRELSRMAERMVAQLDSWSPAEVRLQLAAQLAMIRRLTLPEGSDPPELPTAEQARAQGAALRTTYWIVVQRAYLALLFGNWAQALRECEPLARDHDQVSAPAIHPARFTWLYALALAQRWRRAGKDEQRRIRARLRGLRTRARAWARQCPDNFAAGAALVEAELAAIESDDALAQRSFERALELARAQGQLDMLGLYCEAFARFAQRRERVATAHEALRQTIEAHRQWGATALVRELERRHGAWLSDPRGVAERLTLTATRRLLPAPSVTGGSTFALDVVGVMSTLQAISEELRLDEVVMRVLEGVLENAGAERGSLLLEREGVVGLVAISDGARIQYFDQPLGLREAGERVPLTVLNFVLRTGKSIVLDDAQQDSRFANDPYVVATGVRSLLCTTIVRQGRRVGALVLENRLSTHGFDGQRLEILHILVAQAANALDNARLCDALQRSEAKWRSLVEGVPDIIALLDDRGQIEFMNHLSAYHAVPYRRSASSLVGESAEQFLDAEALVAWRQAFAEVLATGELRELEVSWTPSEGADPNVYVTRLAPITFGGRVGKVLSITTDVSERRRNEAQRARLESQLRQQQRLESIGTLASGVAHEINNPVQGIMNYAELIGERADDPALVEEFAREIGDESQRVATIVRNLLAFSRQERESPYETADVAALIEDTLSLVRTVIRKDQIKLDVVVAEELPTLRCRTQQIQQIIMNLVTNARDALNERWKDFAEQKRIELRADAFEREGRSWVRISVEDRGGGIPAAIRGRIFEPFFTTKGSDQNTGLGLAVSQGIANDHGGELRVESEEGVGSCFHVELPVSGTRES